MLTKIEEIAKIHADNYLVTDALLKAKDLEIANLTEAVKFAAKINNDKLDYIMELEVGAQSALNGMVYFKGKWEEKVRHSMGGFE